MYIYEWFYIHFRQYIIGLLLLVWTDSSNSRHTNKFATSSTFMHRKLNLRGTTKSILKYKLIVNKYYETVNKPSKEVTYREFTKRRLYGVNTLTQCHAYTFAVQHLHDSCIFGVSKCSSIEGIKNRTMP